MNHMLTNPSNPILDFSNTQLTRVFGLTPAEQLQGRSGHLTS
uniref:Uncharacterized protein n=1 Tax=Picea glauca TaxID=3330 RepID=A0A124GMU4_PICGL|nr:hypothetical protein ABT39_MTgene1411 [Picea glauca]